MLYFIFKDIRSDSMKNIIVESLPPVSKPPKRYTITEVDGSNKSKIDIYGYKAYEKTIPIWFMNTNIDQVINWLDGSGRLILSDEPDRYYDAYILNQIDYEKAIRYRKANVTFMVQPYKYALNEALTTSNIVYNQGNTDCLPLMTIYGSGIVDVIINGVKACSITINEYITLDGEEQEASKGDTLQNRLMVGGFPQMVPGENKITFAGSGYVTKVETLVRSRWL